MGPKGMGAPAAYGVSGHRALKKQQKNGIMVSLDVEKEALQMNFSYFNKMTGFTNVLGSTKYAILFKISQNICGPLKYELITINRCGLNLPKT